ncbi:cache domain-containing protein [Pseudomonas anguilliseptica]|uniref:cache domain-containing protein n=1 Tax=Pseudomonas anguilliseptica TaxID=53406 RepID=UPI003D343E92
MRFKSIQSSVALMAGASILAVVVALVLYALFAGARTQTQVQERTQSLLEGVIDQRLNALAKAQVGQLQRQFEHPMTVAKSLATLNSQMGSTDGSPGISLTREELSNLVGVYLKANPELLDLYIGWEANAFDQDDDLYVNQKESGYDHTGRFMPWWYRDGDQLKLDGLTVEQMESEEVQPTGVRTGEYYLCPKETGKPCVIDPASYDFGGKQVLVAAFNAPIMVNDQFRGIAGNDLALDFIQELLTTAKAELYDGAGELALIASNGTLIAATQDAALIGQPASKAIDAELLSQLKQSSNDQPINKLDEEHQLLQLLLPLQVAGTSTRWTLAIVLPTSAVFADLNALQVGLTEQAEADTLGMALVGLLAAGIGMLVIWFSAMASPAHCGRW